MSQRVQFLQNNNKLYFKFKYRIFLKKLRVLDLLYYNIQSRVYII